MPSKGCRYLTSRYEEPQVGTISLLPHKHPLVPSLHRDHSLEHGKVCGGCLTPQLSGPRRHPHAIAQTGFNENPLMPRAQKPHFSSCQAPSPALSYITAVPVPRWSPAEPGLLTGFPGGTSDRQGRQSDWTVAGPCYQPQLFPLGSEPAGLCLWVRALLVLGSPIAPAWTFSGSNPDPAAS